MLNEDNKWYTYTALFNMEFLRKTSKKKYTSIGYDTINTINMYDDDNDNNIRQ